MTHDGPEPTFASRYSSLGRFCIPDIRAVRCIFGVILIRNLCSQTTTASLVERLCADRFLRGPAEVPAGQFL